MALFDADTNVNLFGRQCFSGPVKPHFFVHSPIVVFCEERGAVYASCLSGSKEKSNPFFFTHAIVGVGAFTRADRLYDEG